MNHEGTSSFTVGKAFRSLRNANEYAKQLIRETHPDAGEWDDYEESLYDGMLRISAGNLCGDQAYVEVVELDVEDEEVID